MAVYSVNKLSDAAARLAAGGFLQYDVIQHKEIDFAVMVGFVKQHFPNIQIVPCSPGTSLYTQYGYNTALVAALAP